MKLNTHHPRTALTITLLFCISVTAYAQCLEGDCQDGKGTFLFPGGSKYIGEWKNGQMNGKGEFISSSGAKYTGEWQDGKLSFYTYTDGNQDPSVVSIQKQGDSEIVVKDLEKRLGKEGFDPSTDLPAPAAGKVPHEREPKK